jgi:hypothetical protein
MMRVLWNLAKGTSVMLFSDEQKERLKQWSNVYGWSPEDCPAAAEADDTLRRLLDVEMGTEGMAGEAHAIRGEITKIEACHLRCVQNVEQILEMIGKMEPATVLGCGDVDAKLAEELRGTIAAAAAWVDGNEQDAGELKEVLGERTPQKQWLVACLCKTLAKQLEHCQGDEPLPQPQWPVPQ